MHYGLRKILHCTASKTTLFSYLRLSLKQFMEGPTILVLNHMYNRQMSYMSGVMTCRSTVNGVSLGEKLSKLTIEDLQLMTNKNTDNLH
jgi:hypothetical protein